MKKYILEKESKFERILVPTVQVVLGAVFVFSGFVKCIDPQGTSIKLGEYFNAFGWTIFQDWTMVLSVILCLSEFFIGFNILFGRNIRMSLTLCTMFMSVFTPLTLYLALANPVSDCGCFGDAVILTNWQTFWKNIVLSALLVVLWWRKNLMKPLLYDIWFTIYAYYVLAVCVGICWWGIAHLPIFDFRPFRPGVNIQQAMGMVSSSEEQAYTEEYFVVYEKNGEQKEFTLDNYPADDTTWTFVEQRVKQVPMAGASADDEKGETSEKNNPTKAYDGPIIKDFFLTDADGNDITADVLTEPGYTFLLVSVSLRDASEHDLDRIAAVYEYALDENIPFYGVTVHAPSAVEEWIYKTGAEYPFIYSDATILETVIRANPGLVLLHEGTLCWKKNVKDIDVETLTSAKLNEHTDIQIKEIDAKKRILWLSLLFFVPLILILLAQKSNQQFNKRKVK